MYRLGYILGIILNIGAWLLNKTFRRKNPITEDYRRALSIKEQLFLKAGEAIGASVSFSLLMFGLGIIIIVVYMLIVQFS